MGHSWGVVQSEGGDWREKGLGEKGGEGALGLGVGFRSGWSLRAQARGSQGGGRR